MTDTYQPENFFDEIEPAEESISSDQAEAIAALIDDVFSSGKFPTPSNNRILHYRMQAAFRKFVALAFVMRPSAISTKAITARQVSEALSMTRAGFSSLCVQWSDRTGMRSGGMKSAEAREAYRRAGRGGIGRHTPRPPKGSIGDQFHDQHLRADQTRTANAAIRKMAEGGDWGLAEVRALLAMGWIDEDGVLTGAGQEQVADAREDLTQRAEEALGLMVAGHVWESLDRAALKAAGFVDHCRQLTPLGQDKVEEMGVGDA